MLQSRYMHERQFIPIEGDPTLTGAENEAREEDKIPEEKKATSHPPGMSGLKKLAGITAMAGSALLHPEAAAAQQQTPDRQQKIEHVENIEMEQGWLNEAANEYPVLKGATIRTRFRADPRLAGPSDHSMWYVVDLNNGQFFNLRVHMDGPSPTHAEFVRGVKQKFSSEKEKAITEEDANRWLSELAHVEPGLRSISVKMKAGYVGSKTFFHLYAGDNRIYSFTIPAGDETQKEFELNVRKFLNGDGYKPEVREGTTVEFHKGAPLVMANTGIDFTKSTFSFSRMPVGVGATLLRVEIGETVMMDKLSDTDLELTVTQKDGATSVYSIQNGRFEPSKVKHIR